VVRKFPRGTAINRRCGGEAVRTFVKGKRVRPKKKGPIIQKGKVMSSSKSEANTNRVQVGNLPQQEKELKDKEAEKVKGGYGPYNCSGEEIPQTVHK